MSLVASPKNTRTQKNATPPAARHAEEAVGVGSLVDDQPGIVWCSASTAGFAGATFRIARLGRRGPQPRAVLRLALRPAGGSEGGEASLRVTLSQPADTQDI